MEPWISENQPRKQSALALGCLAFGLALVLALWDYGTFGSNRFAGFLLGLLLLGIGLGGLLVSGRQSILIDARERRIVVEDSTLFGVRRRILPFGDITKVGIGFLGKHSNRVTWYYLVLTLRSGEDYPLFAPGRCYEGALDRSTVEGWKQRLEACLRS